jgi:hypothetical protein
VLSRRKFLVQGALGALAIGAAGAVRSIERTPKASAFAPPPGLPTFDVTHYGAFPNGDDATSGFQTAVNLAQANPGGGIVNIPAGTYVFNTETQGVTASVGVHGANPVYFQGAGRDSTELIQQIPTQALISVSTNSTRVSGLTLNCRSFTGGSCLIVNADNTVLYNCRALGSKGYRCFTLFYAGPPGQTPKNYSHFNSNNQVVNCIVVDEIEDDGFSFSFQQNAVISGIQHYGSRLALYVVKNVLVTDYTYQPNFDCDVTRQVTHGYYITPPSDRVKIQNFTTTGYGGIVGGNAQTFPCTNITIINERFQYNSLFPGKPQAMEIGTSDNVSIIGGNFGNFDTSSGKPLFFAPILFDGPLSASNVTIQSSGAAPLDIPAIRFIPSGTSSNTNSYDIKLENVSFPAALSTGSTSGTTTTSTTTGQAAVGPATFRNYGGPNLQIPKVTIDFGSGSIKNQGAPFTQGYFGTEAAGYLITAVKDGSAPLSIVPPTIVVPPGSIGANTVLQADPGAWSTITGGTNTYSYLWQGGSATVTNQPTYTVTQADVNKHSKITLQVTAHNTVGSAAPVTSKPVTA